MLHGSNLMDATKQKISIKEHNDIIDEVKVAHAEYQAAKALAAQVEGFDVLPNCPECKGEGEVEDGYGDPAHNPTQAMLYRQCSNCKGKIGRAHV